MLIWTGSGYQDIPTFQNRVGDGSQSYGQRLYTKPSDYDPSRYTTGTEHIGEGGDNPTNMDWWQANDSGKNYMDHMGWSGQFGPDNFQQTGFTDNTYSARMKSGEKDATDITWTLQGDQWVPQTTGQSTWDTNASNRMRNLALGSVVGAGLGGIALGYGAVGAGAGEAAAGAGAAEGISGASVESLWPGASSSLATGGTGATGGYMGALEGGSLLGGGGAAAGGASSTLSDLASSAGQSVSDYVSNPSNWKTIAQLGGLLAGGVAGSHGGGGSGSQAAIPVATPQLWGGGDPSQWMGGGGYKPQQGPTQTQNMFNQYMGQQQAGLPGMTSPNMGMNTPDMGMVPGANQPYGSKQGLLGMPDINKPRRSGMLYGE
jgi:hypothetical protein